MGRFVNNGPNILLIVEGDTIETAFFRAISSAFGIKARVVPYRTNIYKLYDALKQTGFNANVCGILKESAEEKDKGLFDEKYAAIYLIYDADFQHCDKGENALTIDQRIEKNLPRLEEMAAYFINETDDGVGKLFINYPMMEAYRDCDCFFEDVYRDRNVPIDVLMHDGYKSVVSHRRVNGKAVRQLTEGDFRDIVRCALYKYSFIIGMGWSALPYLDFIKNLFPSILLDFEKKGLLDSRIVRVINSSVLFVLDYKGNKDDFYNKLANMASPNAEGEGEE